MAESSQVTITLGRSGQVVKRVLDNEPIQAAAAAAAAGSKRSVRDRLGSISSLEEEEELHNNKRLRGGDNDTWASNCLDDLNLSKDDLRFKIMKRTQSSRQQNMMDLRDMLSRSARPSTANPITSYSMHEARHGRQRMSEPRHMPEPRHERQSMPQPRGDRQRMGEPVDGRSQCMPEPREVRNWVPKLNDVRPRTAERPIGTSLRTSEGPPPRMGYIGDSYYSPWTLDHIRRKSPDRVLNARGLSPQRRRAYGDSRSVAYGSRDVSEKSRPVPPTSFLTKQPLSVGPTPLVAPTLPPGGNMKRSQYPVERVTVEGFLRSLGLEKYLISFKVEEVDMSALSQMGDQDLKELGIPMGPRKKILLALLARTQQQQ